MLTSKQLHAQWLRASALFTSAHQELEEELKRMRERKVQQEFIDKKDNQIEALTNFYNQTDELLNIYRLTFAQYKIENHFLQQELAKQLNTKEAIQALVNFNPTLRTELRNKENRTTQTISDITAEADLLRKANG